MDHFHNTHTEHCQDPIFMTVQQTGVFIAYDMVAGGGDDQW